MTNAAYLETMRTFIGELAVDVAHIVRLASPVPSAWSDVHLRQGIKQRTRRIGMFLPTTWGARFAVPPPNRTRQTWAHAALESLACLYSAVDEGNAQAIARHSTQLWEAYLGMAQAAGADLESAEWQQLMPRALRLDAVGDIVGSKP